MPGNKRTPLRTRFLSKIRYEGTCWVWTARKNNRGYGVIGAPGGRPNWLAHRVSWQLHRGAIPYGLEVMHSCDTPACVNPEHLRLGTHAENMAEMARKGRAAVGERHGSSKLTIQDVALIRSRLANGEYGEHIARDFHVCRGTIYKIRDNRCWRTL